MIKVAHIITGLGTGGAEMMLYKLVLGMDKRNFTPLIVSLTDGGTIGEKFSALGVPVHTLGMSQGRPSLAALRNLVRFIENSKPDVIQGWMYHGNLAALIAAKRSSSDVPIIWNIRHTIYRLRDEKPHTVLTILAGSLLSGLTSKIIYNSKASARQHMELGYKATRTYLIPNGFDCDLFRPSSQVRMKSRKMLGLTENHLVIGLIARYHAMKDHANFLEAAGQISKKYPNIRFLLVGHDVDQSNPKLTDQISRSGLGNKILLLGERQDIPNLTAALDIATSSSAWGEAFPNVIGEAMATGVPCVVTDIGDSAEIVGNTGKVVPPNDPCALAAAWENLVQMGHDGRTRLGQSARQRILDKDRDGLRELGLAARQRIIDRFSLDQCVKDYECLYTSLVPSDPHPSR